MGMIRILGLTFIIFFSVIFLSVGLILAVRDLICFNDITGLIIILMMIFFICFSKLPEKLGEG